MKLGVLVSGHGTNLQALIDAKLEIAVVISNKPGVHALERAKQAAIPALVIEHGDDRIAFEDKLLAALAQHGVEAVVLAGFMRVLTKHFVDRWPLRMINTHPSLLPAFPGANAAAQAIAHGVKVSGVTIHFVDSSLDGGPIIAQAPVPVLDGDDAATLQARIQATEHSLLVEAVRDLAAGRLSCQGRHVGRQASQA